MEWNPNAYLLLRFVFPLHITFHPKLTTREMNTWWNETQNVYLLSRSVFQLHITFHPHTLEPEMNTWWNETQNEYFHPTIHSTPQHTKNPNIHKNCSKSGSECLGEVVTWDQVCRRRFSYVPYQWRTSLFALTMCVSRHPSAIHPTPDTKNEKKKKITKMVSYSKSRAECFGEVVTCRSSVQAQIQWRTSLFALNMCVSQQHQGHVVLFPYLRLEEE